MKTQEQVEEELKPLKELFKHNFYHVSRLSNNYWSVDISVDDETKITIELPSRNLKHLGLEVPQ